jgi:hypothetical protein
LRDLPFRFDVTHDTAPSGGRSDELPFAPTIERQLEG